MDLWQQHLLGSNILGHGTGKNMSPPYFPLLALRAPFYTVPTGLIPMTPLCAHSVLHPIQKGSPPTQ